MKDFPRRCLDSIRLFFRRHPLLRDALLWAIPALIFGAVLRLLLLSYSPYAYFGSDSRSYFSFSQRLLEEGAFSLQHKRRFLYPILLLPVSILPGNLLQGLAWLQAALGLATLWPLAYAVRKLFVSWRLLIVPVTLLFAGMPILLWYEHEMLAETVFFAAVVWAFAGWSAWAGEPDPARAKRLWWCFFVPFSVLALTKPAARFFVPGLLAGLALLPRWRWRIPGRPALIAAATLAILMLNMGDSKQSAWLLYTSAFPLTRLDTPLHAEYKAEIRERVEKARNQLGDYSNQDEWPFYFLRNPSKQRELPLWRKLGKDEKKLRQIHKELALEAIRAQPLDFLYISLQRLVRSANMSEFKEGRFAADYFAERFKPQYEEGRTSPEVIRALFDLSPETPLPPFEEFKLRLAPDPGSRAALWLTDYVRWYGANADLYTVPENGPDKISRYRPTVLGGWLIAGALLSLTSPYRKTLGVWTIAIAGYLVGVFLIGTQNVRYFGAAYPLLLLLLAVPVDLAIRLLLRGRQSKRAG